MPPLRGSYSFAFATWQEPGCAPVVCESGRRTSARRSADASASLRRPRSSAYDQVDQDFAKAPCRPDGRHPAPRTQTFPNILKS